VTSQPPSCDTR